MMLMISEKSLYLHFLRILSAVIVCLGHTKEFFFVHMNQGAHPLEKSIRLFLGLGTSAVVVFFFLSGYLVGGKEIGNLLSRKLNFKNYIFDRLTRLWIVLIPALILTYILNSFTCGSSKISLYCSADSQLASHSAIPPLFSQKILDFISNIFFLAPFKGNVWGGNGPLWSLSYEFWYYIVFFSCLAIYDHWAERKMTKRLIPSILILLLASRILNFDWLVLGIIWLSGALVAQCLKSNFMIIVGRKLHKRWRFKFICITFVATLPALIGIKVFPRIVSFPLLILLLTFCLMTMENDLPSKMNGKLQSYIVRGSEFSFSLYLIHFPLVALAASILVPSVRWKMTLLGLLWMMLLLLATLLFAFAFAKLTEFKLVRLRRLLIPLVFRSSAKKGSP
jgi:peptidoglycan/LPS O-acetylase OafA/YrhL